MVDINKRDISSRIALLDKNFDENYSQRNVENRSKIYQEAFCLWNDDAVDLQMAKALRAFLEQKEISLKEYDLFAGHLQHYNYKDSIPLDMPDSFDAHTYPRLCFDIKREIDNFFNYADGIFGFGTREEQRKLLNEFSLANDNKMYVRGNSGHVVCGYDRVILLGLPALINSVGLELDNQKEKEQRDSTEAMLISLKALQNYILRYAEEADNLLIDTTDPLYCDSLRRISASCRNIAYNKPECLFDALQIFVLTLDVMISENFSGSISIGRFDQFIYPYYQADKKSNRITLEEAAELIDAVWLKIASLKTSFQNLTLGGCDEKGNFAGNEITILADRKSVV